MQKGEKIRYYAFHGIRNKNLVAIELDLIFLDLNIPLNLRGNKGSRSV